MPLRQQKYKKHIPAILPMLLYAKQDTMGGRSFPVRHYPVAMRLRDRKGRAILCLRLSSKWGLVGRCTRSAFRRTPSHKNTLCSQKSAHYIHFKNNFLAQLVYLAELEEID